MKEGNPKPMINLISPTKTLPGGTKTLPEKMGTKNKNSESVFNPDGMKFPSTIEATKFLESIPEAQCNREVTNTSQSWSQKTPGKKPGILEETKLKSSPAQKTPKIYENEDQKIVKKEEFQSPKRIPNKDILKIIQFLDNDPTTTIPQEIGTTEEYSEPVDRPILPTRTLATEVGTENSKPGAKEVSNFQLDRTVHPRRGFPSHRNLKKHHDAKGVPNFQLDHNNQIVRTSSGHPRCNYCLIASHTRVSCKYRQHDLNNNIDRAVHPQRGLLSYKFSKGNPGVECDREITNTSQSRPQKTQDKKPGILKETKLRSSPTHRTPKIYENKDSTIFKKKENLSEASQSPKQRRISNKDILEIIQFLDNDNIYSKPGERRVPNFHRHHDQLLRIENSKPDTTRVSSCRLDDKGRVVRTNSGHPRCNYCFDAAHPRVSCELRKRDLNNNVDLIVHPLKGSQMFQPWFRKSSPNSQHTNDQTPHNTSSIVEPTTIGTRRPANTTTTRLDEFGTNRKVPYTFY